MTTKNSKGYLGMYQSMFMLFLCGLTYAEMRVPPETRICDNSCLTLYQNEMTRTVDLFTPSIYDYDTQLADIERELGISSVSRPTRRIYSLPMCGTNGDQHTITEYRNANRLRFIRANMTNEYGTNTFRLIMIHQKIVQLKNSKRGRRP